MSLGENTHRIRLILTIWTELKGDKGEKEVVQCGSSWQGPGKVKLHGLENGTGLLDQKLVWPESSEEYRDKPIGISSDGSVSREHIGSRAALAIAASKLLPSFSLSFPVAPEVEVKACQSPS